MKAVIPQLPDVKVMPVYVVLGPAKVMLLLDNTAVGVLLPSSSLGITTESFLVLPAVPLIVPVTVQV